MVTANPKRAEVKVNLGEETTLLRYTWDGLAKLKEIFGDEIETGIQKACAEMDFDKLSEALKIGLEHDWPDVTIEEIKKMSPPILGEDAFTVGIFKALNVTIFGQTEAPAFIKQAAKAAEKKIQVNGARQRKTKSKRVARPR